MDIYVIRDGVVAPYLFDVNIANQLPVLPPEIDLVELKWVAKTELVSANNRILYHRT